MHLLFALPPFSSTPLDTHIQYDSGDAIHTASIERGTFFCFSVTDATGEFNDAVMHLYTDRAGRKRFITLELSENVLLNLCVIFHRVISMLRMARMPTADGNG